MWVFLLSTVIILCVIHVLFNYNSFARLMRKIQGPDGYFIVGNALQVMVSPDELMDLARGFAKKFPNIHRFWCFPVAVVVIYNPEDIEIVTSTMKHSEKSMGYTFLKPWLQEGLLLSKNEKWQTRRKILTPTFHFNILRQFSKILQENAQRLLDTLEATAERPIDVVPIISEFTLSSICETAMGTQLNKNDTEAGKTYKEAIYKIGSIVTYRFTRIYLFMDSIFNLTQMGSAQKKVLEIIRKFTTKVIRERKELLRNTDLTNIGEHNDANEDIFMKKSKKVAMLDLLISAEKEGLIDQAGIQEEVDTFMFEGHDTTASGLTFCMQVLANNKHIQDKAAKEINELIGDPNRPIEMEDLRNMRYLECCIKESLRMYPPVPFIGRSLTEDVTLSNYHVPAGVQCHISIYDLHHREDLFPNPSVFDPDRFLPENCIGRHPYSYIPFSAGPRNCIGQKFAMLEMKLVLAEVLRKFELQPVTRPEDLKFVADLVLRNKDPVYVTFAKRNKTL
ncbi:cytochrome P450 4C1-like [Choristoneura fumiferana]|uniref:cytochrome P450 4C1-like n=1 Tax=Choristoneura fumiferana TaxID=7141 RepID=UPI003D15DEBD